MPEKSAVTVLSLDHLVLTVSDIERSIDFYTRYLGMQAITFGENRKALKFGRSKINLHQVGKEIRPHAAKPVAGSADLCLLIGESVDSAREKLLAAGEQCTLPAQRTGACGTLKSIYLRDPDGNLIELANEIE